jgi:hypothetical protein
LWLTIFARHGWSRMMRICSSFVCLAIVSWASYGDAQAFKTRWDHPGSQLEQRQRIAQAAPASQPPTSLNDKTCSSPCSYCDTRTGVCLVARDDEHPAARANDASGTLICLRPVFMEETRLRGELDGNRSTTIRIAQAMNHLRAKYCRLVAEVPKEQGSVHVRDNCFQNTGVYRGERVFWSVCQE